MQTQTLTVRRARRADYAGIQHLAATYYKGNLSPDAQKGGFLSAQFSLQQITGMGDDLGIMVAVDHDEVVAFACASRCDYPGQPPIVQHMLDQLAQFRFMGHPIDVRKTFVYGPVCIDAAFRKRGLLRCLYECMKREVGGYRTGIAFVADDNPASLGAHVDGLGMQQVGRFDFTGKGYQALAFDMRLASAPPNAN